MTAHAAPPLRMKLRIVSRGSALALWQARHVQSLLAAADPARDIEIRVVSTVGDRVSDVPLSWIGDRGLFTREIDRALLDGEADLAVHSLKDLPTRIEPGLAIAAILERIDPADALIARGRQESLGSLPAGAVVGTSSLRRRSQLLALRPDLIVRDLRGNVDTRLERVHDGDVDAAILAVAGVTRLGRTDAISMRLDAPGWLPAVGQGALAIVTRDDSPARAAAAALDHPETRRAAEAERALLARLEGGCQVPVGAIATGTGSKLRLNAFVGSTDGRTVVRGEIEGGLQEAEALGVTLAEELIARGASAILDEIRGRPRLEVGKEGDGVR